MARFPTPLLAGQISPNARSMRRADPLAVIADDGVRRLLRSLHRDASGSWLRRIWRRCTGASTAPNIEQCALLYQLVRVNEARLIVDCAPGLSTVWLACALRDDLHRLGRRGGDRAILAIEPIAERAKLVRQTLRAAGVSRYVDIRCLDVCQTRQSFDVPIDLLRIDPGHGASADLLNRLRPALRAGAVVVAAGVERHCPSCAYYRRCIRTGAAGFSSITLPLDGGVELSIKG
jgi:predicted O-methyltransferase YrrM